MNPSIKIFPQKPMNQTASNLKVKGYDHDQNCLQIDQAMNRTIPFNFKTSMGIKTRENPECPSHEQNIFFTIFLLTIPAFFTFSPQIKHFSRNPLFFSATHFKIQSVGCVVK